MRFVVMGIKKSLAEKVELPVGTFTEDNYRTVYDAIADLETIPTVVDIKDDTGTLVPPIDEISELGRCLRNSDVLKNHVITNTSAKPLWSVLRSEAGPKLPCIG